jgi:hypothetical protein
MLTLNASRACWPPCFSVVTESAVGQLAQGSLRSCLLPAPVQEFEHRLFLCILYRWVHKSDPAWRSDVRIVFHQKMVQLQIGRSSKDRDPLNIRRDFRDDRHATLLNRTFSVTGARQTPRLTS